MITKLLKQNKIIFCRGMSSLNFQNIQLNFRNIISALAPNKHKGQAGRIGVVGTMIKKALNNTELFIFLL